ncbi:MAG: DUF5615 family PIN-like protein [Acidobacteriota bacterium]
MNIKLDENVHRDVRAALLAQGHTVRTAMEQDLAGHPDTEIAAAIQDEGFCLVTFDLDFSDVRRYPPATFAGLIVLRLRRPTARRQVTRLTEFFAGLPDLTGRLWIVEDHRARDWTPGP